MASKYHDILIRAGRQDKGGSLPGHAAMGKHKRHHSRFLHDHGDHCDVDHGDVDHGDNTGSMM